MFKKIMGLLDENNGAGNDAGGGVAAATDVAPAATEVAQTATAAAGVAATAVAGTEKPAAAATPASEVKQLWPDDWRQHIAGEDKKELERLGRFATPAEIHKAYRALEARLSSGQLKSTLPANAKPEEVAQWRKENGIPEAPDKYELKLANNLVVGDEDKPFVDEFLKSAHAENMSPAQASKAIQFYFDNRAKQAEERAMQDETQRQAALDVLNTEYGKEFRQNVNLVHATLERFPAGIREAIQNARLPDGTALFNNPDVVRGFVAMAREIDPTATLIPSGQGDPAKGLNDRIAEIEKVMGTNRRAYNKDEAMQQEYRELLEARVKYNSRKA